MSWFILIPLSVGAMTVLQGTINRHMSQSVGLGSAIVLNSALVMALAAGVYALGRARPGLLPPIFEGELALSKLSWWMVFPGVFGLCIIAGIPWAISKLGAARVFVGIVVAQLVASMMWDTLIAGKPLTAARVLGGLLAVAGVALASWER